MQAKYEYLRISTRIVSEAAIAKHLVSKLGARISGADLAEAFKREARKDFDESEISKISENGIRMVMGKAMQRLGYKSSLINGRAVYQHVALRPD